MSARPHHAARLWSARACHFAAVLLGVACAVAGISAEAQDASATIYVFHDSDRTTVVAPRVRAGADIGSSTHVEAAYAADVWTSASIDIRTSASQAITERRDELSAGLRQAIGDTNLEASYRFSTEPDYLSHGVALGVAHSFAANDTQLALSAKLTFDDVGRAGLPSFSEPAQHASVRASWTQTVDAETVLQLVDEVGYSHGYLSSPYRFIGIGSTDGTCREPGRDCLRENNPDARTRNAVALIGRRALGDGLSAGVSYRFYADTWRMLSHTVEADLALLPSAATRIALRYRLYGQTRAVQYQPRFLSRAETGRFFTRDKELSPLISQRLALDFEQNIELGTNESLRVVASAGPSLYLYSDFPPFRRLEAIEATFSLVLEL